MSAIPSTEAARARAMSHASWSGNSRADQLEIVIELLERRLRWAAVLAEHAATLRRVDENHQRLEIAREPERLGIIDPPPQVADGDLRLALLLRSGDRAIEVVLPLQSRARTALRAGSRARAGLRSRA